MTTGSLFVVTALNRDDQNLGLLNASWTSETWFITNAYGTFGESIRWAAGLRPQLHCAQSPNFSASTSKTPAIITICASPTAKISGNNPYTKHPVWPSFRNPALAGDGNAELFLTNSAPGHKVRTMVSGFHASAPLSPNRSSMVLDLRCRSNTSCVTMFMPAVRLVWIALMSLRQWWCGFKTSVNFPRF